MLRFNGIERADANWQAALDACAKALAGGGLAAIPSETVYGLAADATSVAGCRAIFAAKARPANNPLICHVEDYAAACSHGIFNDHARKLAKNFWPGPLTLVVPLREASPVCRLALAGLSTIALRVPSHAFLRMLAGNLNGPVAAPSANRSGRISATCADDVISDLADHLAILVDGGPCQFGIESTIVACGNSETKLLRPGAISRQEIANCLDLDISPPAHLGDGSIESPGQLPSHYAPKARLRLEARAARAGEAYLGFGPQTGQQERLALAVENLSSQGDLAEAAATLFAALRRLDAYGPQCIAVAPIPFEGLGEAINDRLKRAAAPRP